MFRPKRIFFLFLFLILVFIALIAGWYFVREKTKSSIDDGRVKIIISFEDPMPVTGKLSAEETERRVQAIKDIQDAFIQRHAGTIEVYGQYSHIPALAVEVDREALDEIENDPLVQSFHEDMPIYAM